MVKLFLTAVVLGSLLCSCIKEVKFDDGAPLDRKVVVNSLFRPDSLMKIHVSLSSDMSEDAETITNAVIHLYKDGQLLLQPNHAGNGWYNTYHYPEVGALYEVKVSVNGFDEVSGQSSVPEFPVFLDSVFCKKVGNMVVEGDPKIVYNTHLNFDDIDDNNNYYEVFLGSLVFKVDDQTDPSLLMDSDLDISDHIPSLIFSNTLFKNQQKQLVINGLGSLFDSSGPLVPEPEKNPFPLHFHSVSEEYYKYRRSANRHFYLQNSNSHLDDPITLLFMGNPVEMYSNIQGGYGIFAGYNANIFQVEYVD